MHDDHKNDHHDPHDDHSHGGGHGGHDEHGHHHAPSSFEYILWAVGIVIALCLGVACVGAASGPHAGTVTDWLTIPSAAAILLVLPLIAFVLQMFIGSYLGRSAHCTSVGALVLSSD